MAKKSPKNGFGITSLVFGILSLIFMKFVPPLGFIFGLFGIIFWAVQKKRTPTSIATAGLITSLIGLILSILFTILYIFAFFFLKEMALNGIENLKQMINNSFTANLPNLNNMPKELLNYTH